MALNVHLQMFHKQTGIVTASNKYIARPGRYHCPIQDCTFHCYCDENRRESLSFSNFNAVRLHFLRQHGQKKETCSKCFKSFGLHQDLMAHEKICGVDSPFPCSFCDQQFQNRTSLRRHQLKFHPVETPNEIQMNSHSNESRPRRSRRSRPLPSDQIELARQILPSPSAVTVNPLALELLKNFRSDSNNKTRNDSIVRCQSDSDKATQTYTRVSVGTECCSLIQTDFNPIRRTEQKSSQTQGRIRMYKKRSRIATTTATTSKKLTTSSTWTEEEESSRTFGNVSTMTQWDNVHVNDMETQISNPFSSDISIQTVGVVSNILHNSSEQNHSVIVQTLPISMTSKQMQTIADEFPSNTNLVTTSTYLPAAPFQESVGTSCFLDEFLLDDLSKGNGQDSSVLFDFDAMDLLDLIDSGTQTYPTSTTHETQTMPDWDTMLLNEDGWIESMINS